MFDSGRGAAHNLNNLQLQMLGARFPNLLLQMLLATFHNLLLQRLQDRFQQSVKSAAINTAS